MSSNSSATNYHNVECFCGKKARVRTSRTEENPSRRFYACPVYKRGINPGCGFFEWFDGAWNDSSSRMDTVVWHLREQFGEMNAKITYLDKTVEELKRENQVLRARVVWAFATIIVVGFGWIVGNYM